MAKKIIIIGNGISGITTSRFIRKLSDHEIIVISDETDFMFSRPALMYIAMGQMTLEQTQPYENNFWEKNKIKLMRDHVLSIDAANRMVILKDNPSTTYDSLVLATGSQSLFFNWPGQELNGVQGFYTYQDLQKLENKAMNAKRAVIVGGGLIGVEVAEVLLSKGVAVTYLVREPGFAGHFLPSEESQMIADHLIAHGVDLRLESELKEVHGDSKVESITTLAGEKIDCEIVAICTGVKPNVDLAKAAKLKVGRGIQVNENMRTSDEHIYAVGDCTEMLRPQAGRRAIEPVWYTGKMQGKVAALNICEQTSEYSPGIWYNSAKFFDIEYQVYGLITANIQTDSNLESLFWEHESRLRSIRIDYTSSGQVVGFNLMGIRYRHEVCDQWLREKRDIRYVLENLAQANFDPEFFKRYEKEIVGEYNKKHSANAIVLKKKRSLWARA